ncbi:hypothetical protein [Pilimelia columellifera]|uniref:Uncharacterized protein n=1 Tax=Pilimelia columellifera subsp. columellifera TaxID=706583 RepID=A0ABN3N6S9_9ACTN
MRIAARTAVLAATAAAAISFASPALAGDTFNNADISISGGNAASLAACVNYAKKSIIAGLKGQSNYCKNFAKAEGGDVKLKNVSVWVQQEGNSGWFGKTKNNASVSISGGDAVAVAGCVNFLQGSATAAQKNECTNAAVAQGGDVNLKNVSITVIQVGS